MADFGSNQVTPIDLATLQAGAPIAVGQGPETMAVAGRRGPGRQLRRRHADPDRRHHAASPAPAVPLPLNPTGIVVTSPEPTAYIAGGASVVPLAVDRARRRSPDRPAGGGPGPRAWLRATRRPGWRSRPGPSCRSPSPRARWATPSTSGATPPRSPVGRAPARTQAVPSTAEPQTL